MGEIIVTEVEYSIMIIGDFLGAVFLFVLAFWVADNIRSCRKTASKLDKAIRKRSKSLSWKPGRLWSASGEIVPDPDLTAPSAVFNQSDGAFRDVELAAELTPSTRMSHPNALTIQSNASSGGSAPHPAALKRRVSFDSDVLQPQGSWPADSGLGRSLQPEAGKVKNSLPELFERLNDLQLRELEEERSNPDISSGFILPIEDRLARLGVLAEMSEQSSVQSGLINGPITSAGNGI